MPQQKPKQLKKNIKIPSVVTLPKIEYNLTTVASMTKSISQKKLFTEEYSSELLDDY